MAESCCFSRRKEASTLGITWAGVIAKLVDKNVAIDVHQPEKPNPFLRTLGDVAFPLLTIAGIRAATYNAGIFW